MKHGFLFALSLAALVVPAVSPAQAPQPPTENVEQVRNAVLGLIRALVDQGVLTAAKAQEMLRQAGMDPALLSAPQTTPAAPVAGCLLYTSDAADE